MLTIANIVNIIITILFIILVISERNNPKKLRNFSGSFVNRTQADRQEHLVAATCTT